MTKEGSLRAKQKLATKKPNQSSTPSHLLTPTRARQLQTPCSSNPWALCPVVSAVHHHRLGSQVHCPLLPFHLAVTWLTYRSSRRYATSSIRNEWRSSTPTCEPSCTSTLASTKYAFSTTDGYGLSSSWTSWVTATGYAFSAPGWISGHAVSAFPTKRWKSCWSRRLWTTRGQVIRLDEDMDYRRHQTITHERKAFMVYEYGCLGQKSWIGCLYRVTIPLLRLLI